jgi:hypothetical protein
LVALPIPNIRFRLRLTNRPNSRPKQVSGIRSTTTLEEGVLTFDASCESRLDGIPSRRIDAEVCTIAASLVHFAEKS